LPEECKEEGMQYPECHMPPYTVFFGKDKIIGIVSVHLVWLTYTK
jgi:hypothetical protein